MMYQDQHSRRGTARKANNQHFYEKAMAVLIECGFVADGQTPTETYRTGSASNPIYGASGGKLCTVGGRQRFAKPDTAMKATVGKITTCFYEVRDGKTEYGINIKTRETARIKKWATSEVCFKRSDAIAVGREQEWLERNKHWYDESNPFGEEKMEPTRATTGGLEPRFIIERADGKPIDPTRRYSMVLDFSGSDPHAIVAAKAYADSIRPINPQLADDIETAISNPTAAPAQHRYAAA